MRTCGSTAWKSLSAVNIASVIDQFLKLHSFTSESVSESTCQARLRFIWCVVARDARASGPECRKVLPVGFPNGSSPNRGSQECLQNPYQSEQIERLSRARRRSGK